MKAVRPLFCAAAASAWSVQPCSVIVGSDHSAHK